MTDIGQVASVVAIIGGTGFVAWRIAPYINRVFVRAPSRFDKILNPFENTVFKLTGVNPDHRMGWKEYFFSGLLVNLTQMLIAFLVLSFQGSLPLNPQNLSGLSPDLAFHTVVSFGTNTNLQHYSGEYTLSIFSQMMAIQFLQFTSAVTGICMAVAMIRAFVAGRKDMGNFYVDFVRALTRLLIPLCVVASLILVLLGVPQTLNASTIVTTLEGTSQSILTGPVASLASIMQLGTNGGGFYGANAAHPFMNPNQISDIFEIFLMLLLPTALCFVFGEAVGKKRESIPIVFGAYALFAFNLAVAFVPSFSLGPGIETRFGGFYSNFWTVVTTAVTTGSVNASLFGIHPLTIVSAFMGMFIQATPGGNGVGLMYMVMYVIITVFVVGLMSGRTPEYLGFKITGRDVKLVMVAFLLHPLLILLPTVLAYATGAASAIGVGGGPQGFTQIFYEFTTAAANNGSDFLGATANTPFWNISTAIVIFIGRYAPMAILLALGGSMIGRKRTSESGLRTDSLAFSIVLVGCIMILVVLTFLPFLALGPISAFFGGYLNGFG